MLSAGYVTFSGYVNVHDSSLFVTGTNSVLNSSSGMVIGAHPNASNNLFTVANGGKFVSGGADVIGGGSANNLATVDGAGSVWSNVASEVRVGSGGSGNRLTVSNGGSLVPYYVTLGYVSSSNTLLVTDPGSTIISPNYVLLGYEVGVHNQLIVSNGGRVVLADTYVGYNANPGSYKFDSVANTGNPTNYQRLVLLNNARWVSDYLTNGVGGAIKGGAGDVFEFSRDFRIERSSNPNAEFDLASSRVLFSGNTGHTNAITGKDFGHNGTVGNPDGFTAQNFAYGRLSLGSTNDTICFQCGEIPVAPSNALYVTWLDLGTTNQVANLHAPTNINIYYLFGNPDNAYLGNNVYQLTDCNGGVGGLLMPAVPEPSALLLMGIAATLLQWRHRRA